MGKIGDQILKEIEMELANCCGYYNSAREGFEDTFLKERTTAIPEDYPCEEIYEEIASMFYAFLCGIVDVLKKNKVIPEGEYVRIIIWPCHEDCTNCTVSWERLVLYERDQKAWNMWWKSRKEMIEEVESIYRGIKRDVELYIPVIREAERWEALKKAAFKNCLKKKDKYGRVWNLPENELCPICGQPDDCGDCNHKRLSDDQVAILKGEA